MKKSYFHFVWPDLNVHWSFPTFWVVALQPSLSTCFASSFASPLIAVAGVLIGIIITWLASIAGEAVDWIAGVTARPAVCWLTGELWHITNEIRLAGVADVPVVSVAGDTVWPAACWLSWLTGGRARKTETRMTGVAEVLVGKLQRAQFGPQLACLAGSQVDAPERTKLGWQE